jgi:hypothetical protein
VVLDLSNREYVLNYILQKFLYHLIVNINFDSLDMIDVS